MPTRVSDLETPALLIDLDIMERNLARVAQYARDHDLRLRPHTKTHKTPGLGRMQLESGAGGLTVAKVGEAEVMLGAEPKDLLIMYPVIGRGKLERLMEVARRTTLTVSLDSAAAARQLSEAAREHQVNTGVLAEIDVGLGRIGVAPGPVLLDLVQVIRRLPWLEFQGISFYPHVKETGEHGMRQMSEISALVAAALKDLKRADSPARIVSGGSTPTLFHSHRIAGMNEIRPGTYIFNDRNTAAVGACTLGECAAAILATVVSTRENHMIIDGGSKTFSSDRFAGPGDQSFGHLMEAPEAWFYKMNEEHGFVDLRRAERRFEIGDRVRVIPNHVCVAVNLHEYMYGVRGETVEQVWKVEGRGKLQ